MTESIKPKTDEGPAESVLMKLLSDSEFIQDMMTYKIDHTPDGWPAVQQWKIDRLIDIIFKMADNADGRLTVHILRHWDREKTVRFAEHLLGNKDFLGYIFNGRFYKNLDDLQGRTMSDENKPIPVFSR